MEIQGNVFLITGGASGLGAAAARWLAGLGATSRARTTAKPPWPPRRHWARYAA